MQVDFSPPRVLRSPFVVDGIFHANQAGILRQRELRGLGWERSLEKTFLLKFRDSISVPVNFNKKLIKILNEMYLLDTVLS